MLNANTCIVSNMQQSIGLSVPVSIQIVQYSISIDSTDSTVLVSVQTVPVSVQYRQYSTSIRTDNTVLVSVQTMLNANTIHV